MKKFVLFTAFITVLGCWQWVSAEVYAKSQVQLQQSQYFSEPFDLENQDTHYSDFRFDFAHSGSGKAWSSGFEFSAILGANEKAESHYLIPQIYWDVNLSQSLKLIAGRKKFTWNHLDEEWKLGLWQPQFEADPLNIETQAIMGLSSLIELGYAQVYLLASPIFLPSQGAQVETSDGRVVSNSRWFQNRISEITIVNKNSELYFDLNEPTVTEVTDQVLFAGSVLIGQVDDGWWLKSSYAYKPQNNFMIAYNPKTDISVGGEQKTFTEIHPIVYYHHIAAVDLGYSQRDTNFWFSMAHEIPELPKIDDNYVYAGLYESTYLSAKMSRELKLFNNYNSTLNLSYLNRFDNELYPAKDITTSQPELSVKRFKEAMAISIESKLWDSANDRLNSQLKYTRSITEKGDILSAGFNYQHARQWQWFLNFDVLGIEESNESGFISEYRGNDRLSGGFKYVF